MCNYDMTLKYKVVLLMNNSVGNRNIVLDLSDVKEADSAGLRTILLAHRLCKAAGGIFVLICVNDQIKNLISMCKLEPVLTVVSGISEAEDIIFMTEIEKEFRGAVEEDEI